MTSANALVGELRSDGLHSWEIHQCSHRELIGDQWTAIRTRTPKGDGCRFCHRRPDRRERSLVLIVGLVRWAPENSSPTYRPTVVSGVPGRSFEKISLCLTHTGQVVGEQVLSADNFETVLPGHLCGQGTASRVGCLSMPVVVMLGQCMVANRRTPSTSRCRTLGCVAPSTLRVNGIRSRFCRRLCVRRDEHLRHDRVGRWSWQRSPPVQSIDQPGSDHQQL